MPSSVLFTLACQSGPMTVERQEVAGTEDVISGEALERLRRALLGYGYRMLGSHSDAEDAVQETLTRAWRFRNRFDPSRGSVRTWVHKIMTNICVDIMRARGRRSRAVDLGPPSDPGADLGDPRQDIWIEPIPDDAFLPATADPAELVAERHSFRLALIAALQELPPRQRAVLILRDVLSWRAAEVAELLDASTASVNSSLQRARKRIQAIEMHKTEPLQPLDESQRVLLDRYVAAFEDHDVEGLVSLLAKDATLSMPPFGWWLSGRAGIRAALLTEDADCDRSRLVPVAANGSPGFGQYVYSVEWGAYLPRALQSLELADGRIVALTAYLDAEALFPRFGLPSRLHAVHHLDM